MRAPTYEEQTTPGGRIRYWALMSEVQPGEPPKVDPKAAAAPLQELRKNLAETAGVPVGAISAKLGEAGASLKVQAGVTSSLGSGRSVGVCSVGLLGTASMGVRQKLLAAGVRSLTCVSDLCGGTFNFRPDATPFFLTNGAACADINDVLRAAFSE